MGTHRTLRPHAQRVRDLIASAPETGISMRQVCAQLEISRDVGVTAIRRLMSRNMICVFRLGMRNYYFSTKAAMDIGRVLLLHKPGAAESDDDAVDTPFAQTCSDDVIACGILNRSELELAWAA